jgi:inner membrane protease ATP23
MSQSHTKCTEYLEALTRTDPLVLFLLAALRGSSDLDKGSGYPIPINCVPCKDTEKMTGLFDPVKGIVLCENFLPNKSVARETLSHELIHAYDHKYRNIDWKNNIRQHACSEIRAATLSGECKWINEFYRGYGYPIKGHFIECVKRRALLSLEQRDIQDNTDISMKQLVEELLPICMQDTSPFLYIP